MAADDDDDEEDHQQAAAVLEVVARCWTVGNGGCSAWVAEKRGDGCWGEKRRGLPWGPVEVER